MWAGAPWRPTQSLIDGSVTFFFSLLIYIKIHTEHICATLTTAPHSCDIWGGKLVDCCFGLTAAEARFQNERTGLVAQSIHAGQPVVNVSRRKQHTFRFSRFLTRKQTWNYRTLWYWSKDTRGQNTKMNVSQGDVTGAINIWCVALSTKLGYDPMGAKNKQTTKQFDWKDCNKRKYVVA